LGDIDGDGEPEAVVGSYAVISVVTAFKPGYSAQGRAGIGVTAGATTYVNFWLGPE
jgi:hypothetical protein